MKGWLREMLDKHMKWLQRRPSVSLSPLDRDKSLRWLKSQLSPPVSVEPVVIFENGFPAHSSSLITFIYSPAVCATLPIFHSLQGLINTYVHTYCTYTQAQRRDTGT